MTLNKKLKQQVRARAAKTGESYATARRQTLAARAREQAPEREGSAKQAADQQTAGNKSSHGAVSDAKCIERTGHGLAHWFAVLDAFDAAKKGHTAAARHLHQDRGVSAWYAQGITVAYERERGLRTVNQNCDGHFEVSVSRVLPCSLQTATEALSRKARRERWLDGVDVPAAALLRQGLAGGKKGWTHKPELTRLRWTADEGTFVIEIAAKDDGRSRIVVRCTRLPRHELIEQQRAQWRKLLDTLRAHLKAS